MILDKEKLLQLVARQDINAICELADSPTPYQLKEARAGDIFCIIYPVDERERIMAPLFFLVLQMEESHQEGERRWYVKAMNGIAVNAGYPINEVLELVTQDDHRGLRGDDPLFEHAWTVFSTAAIMNVAASGLASATPIEEPLTTDLDLV